MKGKIRVGILGCGAIGSEIAAILDRRFSSRCQVVSLADLDVSKARALSRSLRSKARVVSADQLVERSDLVIEAASYSVVPALLRKVLQRHKSILVMSAGGLLSVPRLSSLLARSRGQLFLPSGALAGIDALLAANLGKIRRVTLITKKPPHAFAGAPALKNSARKLHPVRKETLLFRGTAENAFRAFPQNINVAALLSLAGIGPRKTEVRIYAVPALKRNTHQVEIEGDFGRILTRTENVPSPKNPRTSYLAALSPAALLGKIFSSIKIGT